MTQGTAIIRASANVLTTFPPWLRWEGEACKQSALPFPRAFTTGLHPWRLLKATAQLGESCRSRATPAL
jgi:hypothetical protein